MYKLMALILTIISLQAFAQTSVEDCSDKDNYLQGFISDYYHFVNLEVQADFELQDGLHVFKVKKGQILKITDTNIIDDHALAFDIQDSSTSEALPKLIFKTNDAYEATIVDLEAEGLVKVSCSVITADEHHSQLGRWYYEFRLRKRD